jgi:hypothetical protein
MSITLLSCVSGSIKHDFVRSSCPIHAFCVPKRYGEPGTVNDFCSCVYSRMMLQNGIDSCLYTANTYVILGVFVIMTILMAITLVWNLYLINVSKKYGVLKLNSLFVAVFCCAFASGLACTAFFSRSLTIVTSNQHSSDRAQHLFFTLRLMIAPIFFAMLTAFGMSVYLITVQTLHVPIDDLMDKRRKMVVAIVVLLFCAAIIPSTAVRNYQTSSLIISVLCIVCWWPFKRLGRRLRQGFPIAHLPAAYRERSFAVSEHLRVSTSRVLLVLYFRLIASVLVFITSIYGRNINDRHVFMHLESFADCFNAITLAILVLVMTMCLSVMIRVRLESALNLKAIAMLVSNSPREITSTITITCN